MHPAYPLRVGRVLNCIFCIFFHILYFFAYKNRGSSYSAHILHICCILVILKQGGSYAKGGLICQWGFHILHIQHMCHIWHIQCIVHICHIQHILHILHIQDICSTRPDKWFVKAWSSQTKMRIKARPTCPDNDCPEVLMLEPVQPPAPTFSSWVWGCSSSRMFFLIINTLGLCKAGPLRRAGPKKKLC